ncbi:putative dormancy/auxin associated protein [Medicago truncatula]|uniref:Dormancy/auxin associated protein n=1 Tax=Medicago truncatula TaxID=3880 RepID=G7KXK7_MEDTR|nr:dormancy-associated protein homolog 3 isoform X2 [Medicago truncatula]AES82445.1 dormancy/auxin associated protein [Medicago truncatula]RHN49234.1 putative dormancy/auxin associated protein [Medicago truncatula]
MGLLDQLWDDTVAGPRPENGLSKLRKHNTFAARSNSGKETEAGSVRSYGEESSEQTTRVTRSIMIVKPPGYESGSPLASPAGSTTPVSPFSGTRDSFRFRRRSASDAYEKKGQNKSGPSSPFDV